MEQNNQLIKSEQQEYQRGIIQTYSKQIPELYRKSVKIREVDDKNGLWRKIRESLNYSAVLSGIPQLPTNEEYFILKDFLKAEFKDFSPEEIVIAFYKLNANKLPVEAEHYGKLSAQYLGKVLTSYREYRHKQLSEEEKNKPKVKKEYSEEELKKIRKTYVDTCFVKPFYKLKQTQVNHFAQDDAVYFFKFLNHYKLIELDKAEIEKYKNKALTIINDTARKLVDSNKELRELKAKLQMIVTGEIENIELVKKKAAELYFLDWCRALINSDTRIEDVLNDIGFYEQQN